MLPRTSASPQHFGLDFDSIRKSIDDGKRGRQLRGASTITQQLAKNLFLTPSRSLLRKGVEAYLAVVIEICLPKRRILEIYINIVELGPGVYGAGAASRRYFHKSPAALNDREAAMLAAVLPNPIRLQGGRADRIPARAATLDRRPDAAPAARTMAYFARPVNTLLYLSDDY